MHADKLPHVKTDASAVFSRRRFLGLLLPLTGALMAACGGNRTPAPAPAGSGAQVTPPGPGGIMLARPQNNEWPPMFWRAKADVQEAYRYALANPDVLQYFPCFCGCGEYGHGSNKDCYIQEVRSDGYVVLDPMSFG